MAPLGGYIKLHRRIFGHSHFAEDPFSPREAFIWLVSAAEWEGKQKGTVLVAQRQFADTFKWSRDKVRWWLKNLEKEGMIELKDHTPVYPPVNTPVSTPVSHKQMKVISICNYDKYQTSNGGDLPGHTPANPPVSTPVHTPSLRKKEVKKKEDTSLRSVSARAKPTRIEENFYPSDRRVELIIKRFPETDIDGELSKFVDHWMQSANKTAEKMDWNAAFGTWCTNADKFKKKDEANDEQGHYRARSRQGQEVERRTEDRVEAFHGAVDILNAARK